MLINEQFRKCATYLFVNGRDPETGVAGKQLFGTGFFVTVRSSHGSETIYAVTAQHILDKSEEDGPLFIRMNTSGGHADFEAPPPTLRQSE